MGFDSALLDIICCPVTRLPLGRMPARQLEQLNQRIGQGRIVNRGGDKVGEPLLEALVRRDGKLAYPVQDGIPVLLADAGIDLNQLEGQ